jgi:hypothetical protein
VRESATAQSCAHITNISIFTYQRNDDLAVRVSLEVVLGLQGFPQDTVVVNLAVDSEGKGLVIVDKGLGTRV